jgi:hypothetical protein
MKKFRYIAACASFETYKNGEKRLNKKGEILEFDEEYFDSIIEAFLIFEDYERCAEAIDYKFRLLKKQQ